MRNMRVFVRSQCSRYETLAWTSRGRRIALACLRVLQVPKIEWRPFERGPVAILDLRRSEYLTPQGAT
jgi:hypothetical protein